MWVVHGRTTLSKVKGKEIVWLFPFLLPGKIALDGENKGKHIYAVCLSNRDLNVIELLF